MRIEKHKNLTFLSLMMVIVNWPGESFSGYFGADCVVGFLKGKRFLICFVLVMMIGMILIVTPIFSVEKQIKEKKRIIVGGDYDYPPYEFLDDRGNLTGYNIELTNAIAKTMGLDIEIKLGPWKEIRENLKSGKIDIIHGMFYSKARDKDFDFSPPHTIIRHAIFVRPDSPQIISVEELSDHEIIVMESDIMHDYVVEKSISDKIFLVNTQAEALRLLASGKHDFALIAKLPGLFWIKKLNLTNIKLLKDQNIFFVSRSDISVLNKNLCYAVRKGNVVLISLFSEGLAILKNTGQYRKIYEKWLGVLEPRGVNRQKIIKYALFVITPLILLLGILLLWSRSLKMQVSARTRQLEEEIIERSLAEKEVNYKAEQLKTLYETSRKIASMISKEELLPWIAKQACTLLRADGCSHRIKRGNFLVRGGGTEDGLELMEKERLKIGESLSGIIAKEKKPIVVEDILEDQRYITEHRRIAERLGYVSFLGVPMMKGYELIGVICVYTKKVRNFDKKDLVILSAFADQAAIAIEKSKLFEDLEEAKKELEISERNLKEFSSKLLSIREEEKKNLSRNLHDEVGSMVVALKLNLSIAEKEINNNNISDSISYIRKTKSDLEDKVRKLRKIAVDLRPPDLDIVGLPDALREYFSNIENQTNIKIDFMENMNGIRLNDNVSIVLYRVAQEALNNIIRHAEATKAKIRMYLQVNEIKFNIFDDGKGFDIKRHLQYDKMVRIGIQGMRERIESLGGTFIVQSSLQKGTAITITIPVKQEYNHGYKSDFSG